MRQLSENQMIAILAQAMEGKVGDALRMFMAQAFSVALNDLVGGGNTTFDAGRIKAYREITNSLEAMPGTWKAIQGQQEA